MHENPTQTPRKDDREQNILGYGAYYSRFASTISAEIRRETYDRDIGQNGWLMANELERFVSWLAPTSESHILDVASGAGGPTVFISETTKCQVTGIDIDEPAVTNANRLARERQLDHRVRFELVDAAKALPFADETFDAVICIDAVNHLRDRRKVFTEWHRVLKRSGLLLFTDPITVTGILGSDEIAIRSSIAYFLFAPEGIDERILTDVGFEVLQCEDTTENVATITQRWRDARERRHDQLLEIEGAERFDGLQRFFEVTHRLAAERRLSRYAFLARKR
jgi:SAM-dependent methyltransferase